jgi:hypothetical protein
VSNDTHELVDREVRRIVEACYERARRALAENRDKLESLTQALLEHETLDEDDAYEAAGVDRSEKAQAARAAGIVDSTAEEEAEAVRDALADSTAEEEPDSGTASGAAELPAG